jgi:hypothetical protein
LEIDGGRARDARRLWRTCVLKGLEGAG